MAIYYDDTTLWDYTVLDVFNFLINKFLIFTLLASILIIYFQGNLQTSFRTRRRHTDYMVPQRNKSVYSQDHHVNDQNTNKADVARALLEMKELKNNTIYMMKSMLEKTNSKLQCMIQALFVIQENTSSEKTVEYINTMKVFNEFVERVLSQLKYIEVKFVENVEKFELLSKNVGQTQDILLKMKELDEKIIHLYTDGPLSKVSLGDRFVCSDSTQLSVSDKSEQKISNALSLCRLKQITDRKIVKPHNDDVKLCVRKCKIEPKQKGTNHLPTEGERLLFGDKTVKTYFRRSQMFKL